MSSLRDFYTRTLDDPRFLGDRVEISDELESAIQQVKMTLFTKKGEVLGEPDFGLQFENYLFEYDIDPMSLAQEGADQINKYVSEGRKRQITLSPSIYQDEKANRDILVLLVNIPEIKSQLAMFYD